MTTAIYYRGNVQADKILSQTKRWVGNEFNGQYRNNLLIEYKGEQWICFVQGKNDYCCYMIESSNLKLPFIQRELARHDSIQKCNH